MQLSRDLFICSIILTALCVEVSNTRGFKEHKQVSHSFVKDISENLTELNDLFNETENLQHHPVNTFPGVYVNLISRREIVKRSLNGNHYHKFKVTNSEYRITNDSKRYQILSLFSELINPGDHPSAVNRIKREWSFSSTKDFLKGSTSRSLNIGRPAITVATHPWKEALVKTSRSGGFPKFPVSSCGKRAVSWTPTREPRVVGGEEPPPGAVPWQVELRDRSGEHVCGGALVSRRLVISAAHCWTEGLVAATGIGSGQLLLRIEKAVLHPDFRKLGPHSHDIAILLLPFPGFYFSKLVSPVCLSASEPHPGTWCEVSGWGATSPLRPHIPSPVLQAAAVPLLSLDICREDSIYGGRQQPILDSMVCAGHLRGGVDACGGDSGGPLVCERGGRAELVGVVSWGDGCAKRGRPGVYTRVSSFLEWIREVAGELGVAEEL